MKKEKAFAQYREMIEAADFESGIPEEFKSIPKDTVEQLKKLNMTISAAESLTAGLFQSSIADIPGASQVMEGGFVTYSDEAKANLLHISSDIIKKYTVVSPTVAQVMSESTAKINSADIGVGLTGVAGPDPLEGSPVGTVFIGVYDRKIDSCIVREFHFEGSRRAVRLKSVIIAFVLVQKLIQE
ncbi:nicotinamide-nucleotide amidohydrolase family protein [Companilactobacillus allii]|uniref:Competence protein n=1 Tax=Companilactobacillus allii TaxID=1847728 RepID=A0A1P8Q354_9LACO|nr:nicotinamide-nucleotide amidohydrolase family protein [Companilactobacillus allii]APX72300.1 competence protein [Companilactobacillus allii]USQ69392.1 nicotinamide-nucleotide amidohydrolase family protein [Companilactobacillus allii]